MTITINGTSGITLPSGSSAVGTSDTQTLTKLGSQTTKYLTDKPRPELLESFINHEVKHGVCLTSLILIMNTCLLN